MAQENWIINIVGLVLNIYILGIIFIEKWVFLMFKHMKQWYLITVLKRNFDYKTYTYFDHLFSLFRGYILCVPSYHNREVVLSPTKSGNIYLYSAS